MRRHLIGVLWPDLAETQARRRLTQEMWRINSELGKAGLPTVLTTQGDAITFTTDVQIVCDAQQCLAHLADWQCEHQVPPSSLATLNALVCGELLPGCFDDWVLVVREKLFQMYGAALMRLLAARKRVGDWDSAPSVIDAMRRHDPLSEVWIQEATLIRSWRLCKTMVEQPGRMPCLGAARRLTPALLHNVCPPTSVVRCAREGMAATAAQLRKVRSQKSSCP